MTHLLVFITFLFPKLSDYKQATVSYTVPTPLFSDYTDKERMISIPFNKKIIITGNGLPQFPDGTILFKTFSKQGIKIETRVLLKTASGWEAGTYIWNEAQQDAYLSKGREKRTNGYIIPSGKQCHSCHGKDIQPIGFKARNIYHQLPSLVQAGILEAPDISTLSPLPDWQDTTITLQKRARAYLDMNCAHCHNPTGMCNKSDLRLAYEAHLDPTYKQRILKYMQNGRMPLLGTHMIHKEGVALIADYINKPMP
jgi:mono/diheme cytochrome c family protein